MFQVPCSQWKDRSGFRVPGSGFQVGATRRVAPTPETLHSELGTWNSELRPNPERSCEAGFTLLEVIVALAILGVGFALAIELLATGVRSAKLSEDYTQAVLLARQKMAEIAATRNLEGSAGAGEFGGGFRWASEVHPLPQKEDLPAQLYQVRVRIAWPGRRGEKSLDLYTLRMAVDEKKLGQTRAVPPGGR